MIDSTQSTSLMVARLRALEHRVVRLQAVLMGSALATCTIGIVAFASRRPDDVSARRLVLVDGRGRPGAAIELETTSLPASSGQRLELPGSQWLNISVASRPTEDGSDSLSQRDAELQLSGQWLSLAFGRLGASVTPRQSSGMVIDGKPSLELTLLGKSVYRIDPSGVSRPAS
jgi:hypothetical protein